MQLSFFAVAAHGQSFVGPHGEKAIIVLTYDDGLTSQLNHAVVQLNTFDFKGTFFLCGNMPAASIADWRKVSLQGHELGNHSLYHPCLGNESKPLSPRFIADNYDLPSIVQEINMMNNFLYAITGKKPKCYAYPCSETKVGGMDYADTLKASGLISFARYGGERAIITDLKSLNYLKIPSFAALPPVNGVSLINYAKEVLQKGGVGVIMFHGVGGDYLQVEAEDHLSLLNYLSDHRKDIWVATLGDAMDYIQMNTSK
jgi:peptidoglycan/xylan/chitin deacetylase (PgdA/CDA1 family)